MRPASFAFALIVAAATPSFGQERFRDCADCPDMIVVPAGEALIGASAGDRFATDRERPARRVFVPRFALARTPTTFAAWDACAAAGGCRAVTNDRGWGRGERPVIHVTVRDAEAYAAWISARAGARYRLPSEAEWEYAARAGATTAFPWGETIALGRALCAGCGPTPYVHMTAPVARFAPNAFGLYGMTGNVWAWTADCWADDHAAAPNGAGPRTDGDCASRPLKGGSWYYHWRNIRPAARTPGRADAVHYDVGFRLARDLAR